MTAAEKDKHVLRMERIWAADSVAQAISFDYEAEELATWLVARRAQKVRVEKGEVYVGNERSEIGTRVYHIDPVKFTDALYLAGCAVILRG